MLFSEFGLRPISSSRLFTSAFKTFSFSYSSSASDSSYNADAEALDEVEALNLKEFTAFFGFYMSRISQKVEIKAFSDGSYCS